MTFYEWLMAQRHRSDLVGRFALKAEADLNFPVRVRKLHVLLKYYKPSPWLRTMVKMSHREWREHRRGEISKAVEQFDRLHGACRAGKVTFLMTTSSTTHVPRVDARRFWPEKGVL